MVIANLVQSNAIRFIHPSIRPITCYLHCTVVLAGGGGGEDKGRISSDGAGEEGGEAQEDGRMVRYIWLLVYK